MATGGNQFAQDTRYVSQLCHVSRILRSREKDVKATWDSAIIQLCFLCILLDLPSCEKHSKIIQCLNLVEMLKYEFPVRFSTPWMGGLTRPCRQEADRDEADLEPSHEDVKSESSESGRLGFLWDISWGPILKDT